MLGFSQVLKPIKWQDLLGKGKNGRNAFRTGAKVYFSEKKYCGFRGTLSILRLFTHVQNAQNEQSIA